MPLLLSKALVAGMLSTPLPRIHPEAIPRPSRDHPEALQAGGRATGMGRKGRQKPKVSKDKSLT